MNTTSKVLSNLFQDETTSARHTAITNILQSCKLRLMELFPTGISREPIERFVEEIEYLAHSEMIWNIDFIRKLSEEASKSNRVFCMKGRPNGSYIVHLLRREGVNPLEPYTYCPSCGSYESIDSEYASLAADIGTSACWDCDGDMAADGWNVPVDSIFGNDEGSEELIIMVSDDFLLEARTLLALCPKAQLKIVPSAFCNMLEQAQRESGRSTSQSNCAHIGKISERTLCLEAPLPEDMRYWILKMNHCSYADVLAHYGIKPGKITAEQVDFIEELIWYAKYAYLRTLAKPYYIQWEEIVALIRELRYENPTAAEVRRDFMDHLDIIGTERQFFFSPEEMKECHCDWYVEPTPPANQAQAMFAVCNSINAMVMSLMRYDMYADTHLNDVMDFDAILTDIERMQAGDLAGINKEAWSVEDKIRKAKYIIENGGTDEELARVRTYIDELEATDWADAIRLKAKSFAQGNCLYAQNPPKALEYYISYKNLIWDKAEIDTRTRLAGNIGCIYFDGGHNLKPDYEQAYRFMRYALTGKFLPPTGAVAEALLHGNDVAKRKALWAMRRRVGDMLVKLL